jgi:hypothetical protein
MFSRLEQARIVCPAVLGHAVQAGNDRHVDRRLRTVHEVEVLIGPDVRLIDLRKVRCGLRRALLTRGQMAPEGRVVAPDLLFEQGEQHDRGGTAVFETPDAVECLRERRRRGDDRMLE